MSDVFSGLFGGGQSPTVGAAPGMPDAPEADANEIAQTRAKLERARRGRGSLVRDPSTFTPAGSSGINIQRPIL